MNNYRKRPNEAKNDTGIHTIVGMYDEIRDIKLRVGLNTFYAFFDSEGVYSNIRPLTADFINTAINDYINKKANK